MFCTTQFNCIFFLATGIFITPCSYGNSPIGILEIENNVISVELARTKEEHARGLMNRKSLGKYDGMLFIYKKKDFVHVDEKYIIPLRCFLLMREVMC